MERKTMRNTIGNFSMRLDRLAHMIRHSYSMSDCGKRRRRALRRHRRNLLTEQLERRELLAYSVAFPESEISRDTLAVV